MIAKFKLHACSATAQNFKQILSQNIPCIPFIEKTKTLLTFAGKAISLVTRPTSTLVRALGV